MLRSNMASTHGDKVRAPAGRYVTSDFSASPSVDVSGSSRRHDDVFRLLRVRVTSRDVRLKLPASVTAGVAKLYKRASLFGQVLSPLAQRSPFPVLFKGRAAGHDKPQVP
ncbi:hypothetical protein MRX96_038573 [Rhipicephalus microplus]